MVTRRGFLGSILAAAVAPAIVRADSLMRIVPREAAVLAVAEGPHWHRDVFVMTSDELMVDIAGFERRFLEPAMRELARRIDREATYASLGIRPMVGDIITFGRA